MSDNRRPRAADDFTVIREAKERLFGQAHNNPDRVVGEAASSIAPFPAHWGISTEAGGQLLTDDEGRTVAHYFCCPHRICHCLLSKMCLREHKCVYRSGTEKDRGQ